MDNNPTYKIGYKRPPKHTQFKKGQSGNPRGRMKGSRNKSGPSFSISDTLLNDLILEEASREISVNEGDKVSNIQTIQAILRSTMIKAAKGNIAAQSLSLKYIQIAETMKLEEERQHRSVFVEYKEYWQNKLDNGYEGPITGPLPDQIKINSKTGEIKVVGPFSREDRKENEFYKKMLSNARETLAQCTADLETAETEEGRESLLSEITHCESIIPPLENFVFDDSDELSPYEVAKREGYLEPFLKGPEAMAKFLEEKFKDLDYSP